MRLYDDEGKEYLDFVSASGPSISGMRIPLSPRRSAKQMRVRSLHVSNLFYVRAPARPNLARDVVELLGGGGRCSLQTRGTEAAVEGAIKLARRWAGEHKPGAYKVGVRSRAQLPWLSDARSAVQATGRRASKRRCADARGLCTRAANDILPRLRGSSTPRLRRSCSR